MTIATEPQERLRVVDPDTGEALDLTRLTDREIDELHLMVHARATEWRLLERTVWSEIGRRVREQGGLNGSKRRWSVKWQRTQSVTCEPKEGN